MRCANCTKRSLVEIRMRIGEADVVFRRCGRCETQAWEGIEGDLPLSAVLELARSPLTIGADTPSALTDLAR